MTQTEQTPYFNQMVIEDTGNFSCPWPPSTPPCYPSLGLQMSRLLLCWYKLSMEGLLPHVGWRKVRGRRVAGRGPAYICRFAGWPSQLEPVVVGLGVVRATASWRGGVALPNLGGGYPPGKVPGPKANPRAPPGWSGHFQCARRPGGTSQEVSVKES